MSTSGSNVNSRSVARDRIWLGLLLALGWSVWLFRLGINDLADGDANELLFAASPLRTVMFAVKWPDQSPFYFVVLHFWKAFGDSPFAFRTLNLAIVSLIVIALYELAALLLGSRRLAGAVALLAVLSPIALWMVRNGRMYPLFVLFTILSLNYLLRYLERGTARDGMLFVLACVLSIYTHFLGFMTVGLLGVFWLTERRRSVVVGQLLWTPTVMFVAVLLLVLPQVVRLIALLRAPPTLSAVSLPGLSVRFLNQLAVFSFVNSNWEVSRIIALVLTAAYLIGIYALFCLGVWSSPRLERLAAVWILAPVVVLGMMARRVDLRDRYFVYVIPLIWIATVNGGAGDLQFARKLGRFRGVFEAGRRALLVAVVAASVWLLWHKLPERSVQWTKLMQAADRLYQPTMAIWMPPGSARGIPVAVAAHERLDPAFQQLEVLDGATRSQFDDELAAKKEFLFFAQDGFRNAEIEDWTRILEQAGYRHAVVRVPWASAEFFTQSDVAFVRKLRLGDASRRTLLDWAVSEAPSKRGAEQTSRLGNALVARAYPDGSVKQSVFYISQRGEDGYWKLGPAYWDAVYETRTTSGGIDRELMYAHPANDSVLIVAFPAVQARRSLSMVYGIDDSGLVFEDGAEIKAEIYMNDDKLGEIICSNTPGWKRASIDTEAYEGRRGVLSYLISTANERYRHFHFDFETSERRAR
jgi:hypothetical protein